MTQEVASLTHPTVELPPNAPCMRITAGSGSATQKTWNIRRPVTLVGSRRPAHIVLHDPSIAEAHCVIVNTGTEFLLKDLHTQAGTSCNKVRVDLTLLKDGDVIDVGGMRIHVAVQEADESAGPKDPSPPDPTTLATPTTIGMLDSRKAWTLHEAVTLIGKLKEAPIHLESEEVSDRHAILFRYGFDIGVFDLGGRDGIFVNGTHLPIALLEAGDRVTIGPFGLQLGSADRSGSPPPSENDATPQADPSDAGEHDASSNGKTTAAKKLPAAGQGSNDHQSLDSGLADLKNEIASAWDKLNAWPTPLWDTLKEPSAFGSCEENSTDAADAALRGQLHDLQHLRDQLATRERELEKRLAMNTAREAEVEQRRRELESQENEVNERRESVERRERVVAQRWSRLLAATCPKCAHPFITGEARNGSPD